MRQHNTEAARGLPLLTVHCALPCCAAITTLPPERSKPCIQAGKRAGKQAAGRQAEKRAARTLAVLRQVRVVVHGHADEATLTAGARLEQLKVLVDRNGIQNVVDKNTCGFEISLNQTQTNSRLSDAPWKAASTFG